MPPPHCSTSDARAASSQLTLNTAEHMSTYRDTAQHAAEAVSVSVAQGRSFIARCEDLDREMVKVDALAGQVCVPCPPTALVRGGRAGSCLAVLSTYYIGTQYILSVVPSSEPRASSCPDPH